MQKKQVGIELKKHNLIIILVLINLLLITGCLGIPSGLEPVKDFELDKYLGKWYEIVRLDHSFERNLEFVSAEYTISGDGGINILNNGYNPVKKQWQEARGKAYFLSDKNNGRLKVSFFGPFFSSYNIIFLNEDYSIAVVCGHNRNYFWVLSRDPQLNNNELNSLLIFAKSKGFNTNKFIYTRQQE